MCLKLFSSVNKLIETSKCNLSTSLNSRKSSTYILRIGEQTKNGAVWMNRSLLEWEVKTSPPLLDYVKNYSQGTRWQDPWPSSGRGRRLCCPKV